MLTIEQLKQRKKSIGGSEIAAICGQSKYRSALDVYLDKINPEANDNGTSEFAHWGNVLEPVIASEYARRTSAEVSIEPDIIYHPEHPWAHANIDRWIGDKQAILECKTADKFLAKDWGDETDKVPDAYLLQCAWYSAICNVPYVDIAVLIGGNDFRIYKYVKNENLEKNLLRIGKEFWHNNVLKQVPPPPKTASDCDKLYGIETGELIEATHEDVEMCEMLKQTKEKIKELTETAKDLEVTLKKRIGNNAGLTDINGNMLVTWKTYKAPARFDSKTFREDHAELYESYKTQGTDIRRFVVK